MYGSALHQSVEYPAAKPISFSSKAKVLHPSDFFHMGFLWTTLKPLIQENLPELVSARRFEIKSLKEHWRTRISDFKLGPHAEMYQRVDEVLTNGTLTPAPAGVGAAYILTDKTGSPRFVVKPLDEDIFCLNNRKNHASPLNAEQYRVRPCIPLYRSVQTDVLAYRLATLIGIPHITPRTVMGIYKSSSFYDLTEQAPISAQAELFQLGGQPDREKLCSVQEYFDHQEELLKMTSSWFADRITDLQLVNSIDQRDFEELNLYVWMLGDSDAHGGNILIYVKSHTSDGRPVYGLKKIDNGLSFPEKNDLLFNFLSHLPSAFLTLSAQTKSLIASLPLAQIVEEMRAWEMDACIPAFMERVTVLQQLAMRDICIREINLRLAVLGRENGAHLALSSISMEELEALYREHFSSSDSFFTPSSEETRMLLQTKREAI